MNSRCSSVSGDARRPSWSSPPQFDARSADYVREREWHRSQEIVEGENGNIVLRLRLSDDRALCAWILSFGASARVLSPARLAKEIGEELQAASGLYAPRLKFEMLRILPAEAGSYRIENKPARLSADPAPRASSARS
jgi:hypothetical protein